MGEHRRKADGRRVFSTEFKRATVQRIVTGEKTVAELSRELDIAPSVIRSCHLLNEKLSRPLCCVRPGAVAVCLMVTSRAR